MSDETKQAIERLEERIQILERRLKAAEGIASFALTTALAPWATQSQAQQDVWREHAEYMAVSFIRDTWVCEGEDAAAIGLVEDGKTQGTSMLRAAAWVKQGLPTIRS